MYADVLLPLPIKDLYTYKIPDSYIDLLALGQRVVVQFGKQKIYSALVYRLHHTPPLEYQPKEIISVLDTYPVINQKQFEFWDWLAEYYMCTRGEVMNAALPSAMKLASETKVTLNPSFNLSTSNSPLPTSYSLLNDKEFMITEALELHKMLDISDISKIVGQKNVLPIIKSLIEKGVVLAEEQLSEDYKPKIANFVRLTDSYNDEVKLGKMFDLLEKKAYKQLELLMLYIKLSTKLETGNWKSDTGVKRSYLLSHHKASDSAINSLVKKGVLEIYQKTISRLDFTNNEQLEPGNRKLETDLDINQLKALSEILKSFETTDIVLLNGVTSSGKTEVYVKLINEVLKQGRQVLYLVPEIALTTQLIMRLKKYFGNKIGVYHSKFTKDERVEIWNNILNNGQRTTNNEQLITHNSQLSIIIGPRSAMFLPFQNLGIIIVDEENDTSYKQYDTAPRFNARDAAIYLANIHNSTNNEQRTKVLLGSATPSLESYYNAETGKYGLVEINSRFGDMKMPEIIVVNTRDEQKNKTMKSHFSSVLLDSMKHALDNKEQVILFQNRRGYSLRLECMQCGWLPYCKNCDVSLVYHKLTHQLLCHYCGYIKPVPDICPACGSADIRMKGFGTEKIEDELPFYFSDVKVGRMDLDTTRSKNSYHRIIHDFEERKIDILVGTQMVTKGLDFDNVNVVGVMNADNMLTFPDFRTFERSYQQLSQVSGRAGRKNRQGRVIIQTSNPNHPVIGFVIRHDYMGMYKSQLKDREIFKYPPFFRLIKITIKHKDLELINEAAKYLAKSLRNSFGDRILGPEFPPIARVRNLYMKDILIKIEKNSSLVSFKTKIKEKLTYFSMTFKTVRIIIDVDPQ